MECVIPGQHFILDYRTSFLLVNQQDYLCFPCTRHASLSSATSACWDQYWKVPATPECFCENPRLFSVFLWEHRLFQDASWSISSYACLPPKKPHCSQHQLFPSTVFMQDIFSSTQRISLEGHPNIMVPLCVMQDCGSKQALQHHQANWIYGSLSLDGPPLKYRNRVPRLVDICKPICKEMVT